MGYVGSAISAALCYVNNMRVKVGSLQQARVLVVQRCADTPAKYVQTMNALFAAQNDSVIVDALVMRSRDSTYMQQACDLTGGIYSREPDLQKIPPLLLGTFLTDPIRRPKAPPSAVSSVDARAACFCHKRPLDLGFVCSVCLSIFCKFVPVCSTCNAKFQIPALSSSSQ